MQTVSKYGAVADAEAQVPAGLERKTLGRAKVALICVAAALGGAAVASVAPMGVTETQMMQVACPPGMRAGETVQIVTPAGPMQVVIPQGVSEGQTFSVQLAAPQPQPVAVVTAVPV